MSADLFNLLRRKEGNWTDWASACTQLSSQGETTQQIFEQTGFEPIHQNQITVALKVYEGLVQGTASSKVINHFATQDSEMLYELRVLPQSARVELAEFILLHRLDLTTTKEVIKAMRDFAMLSNLPPGFSQHPGDAIAYQCYRNAQKSNQAAQVTKFMLKGLQYVHSASARSLIEQLLTAQTAPPVAPLPKLPIYRLDQDDQLPRLVPVAGKIPITISELKAVPLIDQIEPFGMVAYEGACAWIALPGWDVVRRAIDPLIILANTDTLAEASGQRLPNSFPDRPEQILLLIDRSQRDPESNSYFAIATTEPVTEQIQVALPSANSKIYGKLLLVLRERRVLDQAASSDLWQEEE
ncbi:MAG: RuBisCO accumulation factor 1 [Pseudanabaenaceae cyanobacterium bins.68]|nr:RuBisCO accumulation factor 1 [Pseudanabaenaceae cyanobacterium bins.68]